MDEGRLRKLAGMMGMGTVVFGVVPFLSPGGFARLFGLENPEAPTVSAAFRSVGARDLAVGMGLWSAAVHGGKFAP
ncbi:MAG TPA: DUF4267 domain-containing protein, partial [Chloroflexota bacterium]|nr:DUF4267 domain-containing protein [Chloroflexota bacterium]